MKTTIYDTELNDFSRKFLVMNPGIPEPSSIEFLSRAKTNEAKLFESLLLFDTISFKVYGENIPLALLLNHFGIKGFEALLEQDAINFILWNQIVTFFVDDIPGVDPLQSGALNSPAHSDPEESIKLGFNWMSKQPRESDKKNIIRKVREKYSLPENSLAGKAVSLSRSAYESGKLKHYGLAPGICTFMDLDKAARKKLCGCAEDILQYSHLINNNMASYSSFEFYHLFNQSNKRIHQAANIQNNFNELAMLENMPDLRALYPKISKPFAQVTKLRNKSSSMKFRAWLAECSSAEDAAEITKEYVDSIASAKGFFQTITGRLTKSIAMSAVGAGVGMLVAGPAGAMGGAGVAKLLEPAADLGLDMLDEFVLSGLTKGWTPKMFLEDIDKLEKSNKSMQPIANASAD